jgi:hypothetical protein
VLRQLLAPEPDAGKQQHQRIERVLAHPRVGCRVGLDTGEGHLDVL